MTFVSEGRMIIGSLGGQVEASRKRRDLLELSVGYGLILVTVWAPHPWQRLFYLAALVLIGLVTTVSFDGWSAMGFRIAGLRRSMWVVGVAILLVAAAVALAERLHTAHLAASPTLLIQRYWGYAIWAFVQEFLLLDFVLLRLLRLLPSRTAAVAAAAGLFALAHLPNPILTPTTLIWSLAAGLLFLQYRNIYPLAITHAILGICIASTVPGSVTHNMKVGLGYLTYRLPALAQPERPYRVDEGMGNHRSSNPALLTPRPAIEHSSQSR